MLASMAASQRTSFPVPSRALTLEGRLTRAPERRGLAIIAPPHPLYGGSIGNPVVRAIEQAYRALALDTLAFNYRGIEESSGAPSGEMSDGVEDYLAAAHAHPEPMRSFSGYSFGSVAGLAAAVELDVPHLLMVAPPLPWLDPILLSRYRGKLRVVVGDDDEYTPLDALQPLLAPHPNARLSVLTDADHFLLGSAAVRLAELLRTVLQEDAP